MPASSSAVCRVALATALFLTATPLVAQQPLPLGRVVSGTLPGDGSADYRITVASAGVLSIATDGTGDLSLQLMDADGQPLPEGRVDSDLDGKGARETLTLRLGEAGTYTLRVTSFGGDESAYQLSASMLAFPAFAKAPDPDGRPSGARALTVGQAVTGALDPGAGDERDWYSVRVATAGTLVLATRALDETEEGFDLALEVFLDGTFDEPAQRSDQDLQENMANEAVTVMVKAGQVVHLRVSTISRIGGRYRLSSTLMD
jgi:hypothetical protein